MKQYKEKKRKPLPITIEQKDVVKILKLMKQPHHKVAVILGFCSGLRISEVLSLKPKNLNYEDWSLKVIDGKGGKDRIVNLPKHWNKGLEKYLPIPCGKRSLQNAFETYATRAGIRTKEYPVHFHTLRHGYATRLYLNGLPLYEVGLNLGHSDVSTTAIYANIKPNVRMKNTMEKW